MKGPLHYVIYDQKKGGLDDIRVTLWTYNPRITRDTLFLEVQLQDPMDCPILTYLTKHVRPM